MPPPSESEMRAYFEALFEKLSEAGWISGYGFGTRGRYFVKWTAKGRERARWVKLVGDELQLDTEGLTTLLTLCYQQVPPE